MLGIDKGFKTKGRGMGTGIVFLSSVLFLFLLTTGAYADMLCTDCHGSPNGPHGNQCGDCAGCHGFPPTVSAPGGANGLVGPIAGQTQPVATGASSAGAHAKHATPSPTGLSIACTTCHYNGMPVTPLIGNNKIQIGFNIPLYGGTYSVGGAYSGTVLNVPYTYEGTNTTTVTTGGSKACSSIYCHADGTAVATGVIPAGSTSPAWDAGGPLACTSCHGYPPSYAQDAPKSNSHLYPPHQQRCNVCHYGTTANGSTITNPANHANGMYNVQPDPGAVYGSTPVNFSYQYDPGGGYCANVSCHNGQGWVWGKMTFDAWIYYSNGTSCYEVNFDRLDFSPGATAPFTYNWDFGDGQTGTGFPITHTYAGKGPYYPTVSGRDANRHPYTGRPLTGVSPQPTNVPPSVNYSVIVSDYTVTLTDLSTDADYNTCDHSGNGKISVVWTGTGQTDTLYLPLTTSPSNAVITRTFPTGAAIDVAYTVTDNAGASVSAPIRRISVPQKYTITAGFSPALVSNGYLYLKTLSGTTLKSCTTTSSCTFTDINPGTYRVQAYKSGYSFDGNPGTAGNQNPVNVTVGPNATVNFTHTP